MQKQFLLADYVMEFMSSSTHWNKEVPQLGGCMLLSLINLSTQAGFNENNEQIISHNLMGLNSSIRDEMGVDGCSTWKMLDNMP